MNRRALLQSVGTASSTLLVGCLSGDSSDDSDGPVASLALAEIENRTGESVDVTVVARRNGTQVHEERYSIAGVRTEASDEAGEHGVIDGVQLVEDWMGETDEYELQFEVPAHELRTSFTSSDPIGEYESASHRDLEGECYFVRVEVGDGSANATPETVPERIGAWAVVYDHDVFDREHAGDCS